MHEVPLITGTSSVAWERPIIELAPQGRYVLKGTAGTIATGTAGVITITPYGDALLALTIE